MPAGTADLEARVECYDRIAAETPGVAAHEQKESAPTEKEAVEAGKNARIEDHFGAERLTGKDGAAPDSITATITNVVKLRGENYQRELDNGQVWRENNPATRVSYKVGDKVTISRALLGAYRLTSHRTGMINKVHRVE